MTALGQEADTPTPTKSNEKSKATATGNAEKKLPSFWQAPAGAIMVLCEQAADGLRLLPKMVVLPPEKYQELLDEIARLKEQQVAAKSMLPSLVQINGKLESGFAKLKIRFSFQTDKPSCSIFLGCGMGQASSALMEGKIPTLRKTNEGFVVQVENIGVHNLDLDLLIPVSNLGENQSFELDLPGAAITQMELEMPPGTLSPKIVTKTNKEILVTFKGNHLSATLGPLNQIQMVWKSSQRDSQPKAITAESNIIVRMDDKTWNSRAEIKIGALGGRIDLLDLVVPLNSEVRPFSPNDENRILSIEKNDQKFASYRKIKLKDNSSDPITLVVETRANIPANGGLLPIGPFIVSGAIRQTGTILLSNQGNDLKVSAQPRGEISSQEVSAPDKAKDANIFASYRYWNHPNQEKPTSITGANSLSLLDLQVDLIRGILEVKTIHTLRLARRENNQWFWNVTTNFDCTPIRTGSDRIEIGIPPGLKYDEKKGPIPSSIIRDVSVDTKSGKMIVLFAQELLNSFQFSLDFQEDYQPEETSRISLPVPMQVRDRGGQITLAMPVEFHLLNSEKLNTSFELTSFEPYKQVWKNEKFGQKIEAIVRPVDDRAQVNQVIDIHLNGSTAVCRQLIHLHYLGRVASKLELKIPDEVSAQARIIKGGTLENDELKSGVLGIILVGVVGKDHDLELEYEFKLPSDSSNLNLPLVMPINTQEETVVRIWAKSGTTLTAKGTQWKEYPIEEIVKNFRLPNASFKSEKGNAELAVELKEGMGAIPMVGKVLARIRVDGMQSASRVSYYFNFCPDNTVDFQMPPNLQNLRLKINGNESSWQNLALVKNQVRIVLPRNYAGKPFHLEWEYSLPKLSGFLASFSQNLSIPTLVTNLVANQTLSVDWWIKLPQNRLTLWPEPNSETQKAWQREGLFLTLNTVVDLWDSQNTTTTDLSGRSNETASSSDLFLADLPKATLTLVHIPKFTFQLIGSILVLTLALASIYFTGLKKVMVAQGSWIMFSAMVLATVVYLLFPLISARIFLGIQPGILAIILGITVIQIRKIVSNLKTKNLSSFSRVGKSLSTIQPGYKKSLFGTMQQTVKKETPDSTGYWVRPDPSNPKSNSIPANQGSQVQDALPD